ncbi:hypothetical protein ACS0PU_011759 [Formica fusca]
MERSAMDDLRRGGDKGYKHLRATAKNYAIKDLFYCCWHYMPGYNLKFQEATYPAGIIILSGYIIRKETSREL